MTTKDQIAADIVSTFNSLPNGVKFLVGCAIAFGTIAFFLKYVVSFIRTSFPSMIADKAGWVAIFLFFVFCCLVAALSRQVLPPWRTEVHQVRPK